MSERDSSRLIHDMNSDLSALFQALQVADKNWREDAELLEKLMPLMLQKVEQLMRNWDEVKTHLPKK